MRHHHAWILLRNFLIGLIDKFQRIIQLFGTGNHRQQDG
ncbi:Uncharacterised protein [Vibrio cholerae]|nr:Uncharacterised protein [Vibrio cholerae]